MPELDRHWTPHPGQQQVLASNARFRICACGRRWGKTEMAAHETFEYAFEHPGANIWWVAPTYNDANDLGFAKVRDIVPRNLLAEEPSRQVPRTIELVNGSQISFRSAEREDSLRGVGLDFLVLDEAGSVPDRAWNEELRPTLADTLGEMLAIGTPKGRNWFHTWHARGTDDAFDNTDAWQSPTYENPHVPDSEIEDAKQEMPQRAFEQEFEAKFIDEAGGVFRNVRDHIESYDLAEYDGEGPYTIGVDLARTRDWAVVIALDVTGQVCAFERRRDTTWAQIQATIEAVANAHRPHTCYVDATRDNKIVQDLQHAGVQVEPFRFTGQSKRDIIESLAARLEKGELTYPDIPELVNELQVYEYETTGAGNIRYQAPAGTHDDCVDALALAAQTAESKVNYVGVWGT